MKIHNYGNDYAQSMKFQKDKEADAGNASKPKVGKTGGEIRAKQLANILEEMCAKEFDLTGVSIYRKKRQ